MRIFVTVIVWVVFIGGLSLYMKHRGSVNYLEENTHQFKMVEKVYALEVTPSFVLESDPFSLTMDSRDSSSILLVRLGNHEILNVDDPLTGSEAFTVEPLQGLIVGENEIYVEASPPLDNFTTQNALRVRIIENGFPLAEKTIWSPPGAKVSGTFQFTLKADENNFSEEEHVHH
ncbi:MAG: hypothetical protein MUD09_08700 [Desulfobacterales bacterium]|jgi:hypothetical protein|nr:hypothetical protein [Desulfobacterales bacterium]